MFPSYRNQSVDLLCKLTDSFLYDGNIGRWRVKLCLVWNGELQIYAQRLTVYATFKPREFFLPNIS